MDFHHHRITNNNNSREHRQRNKMKRRRTKMKISAWLNEKFSVIFYNFSGHQLSNLSSFNDFTKLMFTEVDSSSLGVARALFGLMMLMDIPEERSGDLDLRWGMPKDCRFPLLPFLKPLSFPRMVLVYFAMWLGAFGMTLGYKFKSSCFLFAATYWYIFMLDVSSWNNHSYLYGLVAVIFMFTDAHRSFSIDSLGSKTDSKVPFWNYFLLKFQFFVLYFIAGFKKFSTEWLIEWQYSMTNLSSHWIFAPFRLIMGSSTTDLVMIHWFSAIFDISVAFLLIYASTRPMALILSTAFHTMNSRLFHIGMFPWVCLVELPLFCEREWPRMLLRKLKFDFSTKTTMAEAAGASMTTLNCSKRTITNDKNVTTKRTLKERFTTFLILIYCCLQLFLPFSHQISKGYNGWVDGAYGYSFDMMIQNWHQSIISVKVVDNHSKQTHFIEPLAFTDSLRWTQYPSMAFQYSQCIQENLRGDFYENPRSSVLSSNNFSIYFDIWYSLNGRFHQRIYDPKVDFTKTQWHPFSKPLFVLPLLTEYSHMREEMRDIREKVHQWNNRTNLMFFADFPQLTLENYIMPEMDNVTLHVLLGAVKFHQEENGTTVALTKGQSVAVTAGSFHKVTTISDFPSCFYYTFTIVNSSSDDPEDSNETSSTFSDIIVEETRMRWENYKKFFYHVANSLLFELYNVPMPRRIRATHDM